MRGAVLLLLASGCNQLFDLKETRLTDAGIVDRDLDGVADDVDNCPDLENRLQANDDEDQLGNDCDNCPIRTNSTQDDFDADLIGDACDPHPANQGDCLVLVDSFDDPASLAHWSAATSGAEPTISAVAGGVQIAVAETVDVTYTTALDGPLSVQLTSVFDAGSVPAGNPRRIGVIASATAATRGYRCIWSTGTPLGSIAQASYLAPPAMPRIENSEMSTAPFNMRLNVLMIPERPDGSTDVRCLVEHGGGIGIAGVTATSALTGGATGVVITGRTPTIEGIAFYRYTPGVACGDAVRR